MLTASVIFLLAIKVVDTLQKYYKCVLDYYYISEVC